MNQVGAGPGEAERAPGSGAVALGRGGRMSRQRKSAAVLRLLRGEDLETVSREGRLPRYALADPSAAGRVALACTVAVLEASR